MEYEPKGTRGGGEKRRGGVVFQRAGRCGREETEQRRTDNKAAIAAFVVNNPRSGFEVTVFGWLAACGELSSSKASLGQFGRGGRFWLCGIIVVAAKPRWGVKIEEERIRGEAVVRYG